MNNKRPNVLWIQTDQQRYDTIGALGNKYVNTPVLDKLVETGVAFSNAYCQAPICTPSRGSSLTGEYPQSCLIHRNGQEGFRLEPELVTKTLADNGYTCGLIGKLHLTASQFGLEKRAENDGYSYFQWSHDPYPVENDKDNFYHKWLEKKGINPKELYEKYKKEFTGVQEELTQTHWCAEKTIEFIRDNAENDWLLSVNPFDPHPPIDPPEEFLEKYNHEEIPYPLFKESDIENQKRLVALDQQTPVARDPRIIPEDVPEEDIVEIEGEPSGCKPPAAIDTRKMIAAYYASVELLDKNVGKMIEALKETGQYENTLIIFHSDHGELLGDHGIFYKGCRFYQSLVHIPLIMSYPALSTKGAMYNDLVELVDLAPTILEAAQIELTENIQGKSLLEIVDGRDREKKIKDAVLSEFNDCLGPKTISSEYQGSHGLMMFDSRYKICVYRDLDFGELYDLENDPNEFDNLWEQEEHQVLKYKLQEKLLNLYMSKMSAGSKRVAEY